MTGGSYFSPSTAQHTSGCNRQGLELDEDGKGDVLKVGKDLPGVMKCDLPEHGVTLRPDYAVVDGRPGSSSRMLVSIYGPDVSLSEALKYDGWAAPPAERMVELCRATGVRLGLVTNGEHWMFVDAVVGKVTSLASSYARHWGTEPVTLQAFVSLLGVRRFFVHGGEQLPALLDKSLEHQDEVTDALGEQVRRAVEVLIQALDRADVDRNRELLTGVETAELYEPGLTVMMRIVFLLSAEERGLLLMGDPRYEANYAVSTLRLQLRLGGSLFDPDRFPFLEGRAKGSNWKADPAAVPARLYPALDTFLGQSDTHGPDRAPGSLRGSTLVPDGWRKDRSIFGRCLHSRCRQIWVRRLAETIEQRLRGREEGGIDADQHCRP
jgi:hypothetical protein